VIRAPLNAELEEQLEATAIAASDLENKAKRFERASGSCKTEKAQERNREKSDLAETLCNDAVDQAVSLKNLVSFGREARPVPEDCPSWADYGHPGWNGSKVWATSGGVRRSWPREHQEVDVEFYSYARQREDMELALAWLQDQEENPPGFEPGGAARWASARLADAKARKHERLIEIAKAAKVIVAENKRLSEKEARNQKRIRELNRRVKRLEGVVKEQDAELGQFRVQPNVDTIIQQRNELRSLSQKLKDDKALLGTKASTAVERAKRAEAEVLVLEATVGRLETELRYATAEFSGAQARLIAKQRDDLMAANNKLQNQIAHLLSEQAGSPVYPILRSENERLAAEVQRLTRENSRLEEHIDRISGRGLC
jgi:hypothetical protein